MGCIQLHILDRQYKNTELKVSYTNKKLTLNNSAVKERREILVRFIDPNGMMYDWFQSESGSVFWKDSREKELNVNGEKFRNIGKSVSLQMTDGSFLNYFDNVPLSVSAFPVNTWEKVLNNDGLRAELLSRGSPLSESSKVSLFQASVNKGRQDFIDHPLTQMTIHALLFVATGGLDMAPVKQFPNRLKAWQWEYQQNQILRGPLNKNMH